MDPQLLRPVAAVAAATVQAAGPRGVVYDSSNRQEQLLRLAIRRQLQQEQRQQQHLKQHQVRKDSPEEQRDTLLDEQQQCGHQKEPQYNLEQWQELRQPHPEPLLKCAFSRTEGMMVEQNSFTAVVGSGSVSTANSGSERSSRNASDDEATIVRKRPELQKKWAVGELVYNEDGLRKIPNLSMAQKFTHENLEPLCEQRWQTGPRVDTEQQPQQRHGKEHEGQQQQQQLCSQMQQQQQQQPQELTQHHCGPQDPRHHAQQQQQQLNVSTERTPAGKHLPPYAEEIGLGLHVGSAFLGRRHVHPSTELPPLPPRFAHTADAVPPVQGLFHAMYETGYPGGPVRPARKKVQHPTPRRTFSSSVPASASSASKDRVRSRAGRTYLNSRITEVKSFAGTLEEYLLFRRQQAERKEAVAAAAAAAHSGSSGFRAIGPPNQQLIERMKASTICSGHRRAASAGRQDFTGITATAHSSRSSSRGASATPRCKDNERMQQFPVWERNVAVQQRQRRTTQGIFQQLSKRISESSQQGGNRITGGICATSGDGPGDATAAKNCNRTSKGQNPMLQLRTPTGNNSPLRVARGDDKTEEGAEDERIEVRLSNSSAQRPRRRDISCSQTQESQTDQNSGFSRGDTRKRASATSADNQQEHARREGSVPRNGKREEAAAAGGDAKDTDEHNTDEQKTRGRGRKFIPLEMRNGEILWPTDRPIIPLNAWIFQNFSSDEPLDPQNWVHLPNVGPAISPAISALQSPQSEHPPTRPPISCSTAPLVRSPLVAEARLTEPVKLPPIKLSIGCEVPRFIIQTSTLPEMCTQTEMPPNSSAPTIHGKKIRSRSSSGRLGGAPAARLKSVYTQFYKQTHVRHRPTNFEGIVVRAEDAGRVLLVRSKDGHLRKLHRDECEAVGFMCSSAPPPERLLTDAAHVHSTHLLSATSGSLPETEACSSPGSAGVPAVRGSVHLRNATFCASPAASSARKPPLPPKRDHLRQTTRQGTHVQKHAPGGQMLGATVPECPALPRHHNEAKRAFLNIYGSLLKPGPAAPSPLLERNEEACNRSDNEQTQKLALQQVPDLQEVIKLAQQHASATMPNTVALKNQMATIPAIRAVDSQVTVEAIRVKRYTLEGQEEENLLPVFSADTSTQNNRASSIASAAARPAATKDERGEPPDAVGLLLQEHDARQVLKKREEQLATDEVIYAQDAPEATRARGIAPPTIVKESLVIPPKEDELLYYPQQAPGIMPPLYQYLNKTGKFQTAGYRAPAWPKGSDVSSASTETPDMQHVNGEDHRRTGEGQERAAANDSLLLDAEGPAWFSDLKAQFRNKLLHQYLQTGSMEAAALAISSGGYTPLSFTASYPHLIQRKQAKVLRDELRHMQFAPVGQNKPL